MLRSKYLSAKAKTSRNMMAKRECIHEELCSWCWALHCPVEMHILMVLQQDELTCGTSEPWRTLFFKVASNAILNGPKGFCFFYLFASHLILSSEVFIVSPTLWQSSEIKTKLLISHPSFYKPDNLFKYFPI